MRFCGHCGAGLDGAAAPRWRQAPRAKAGERRLLTVVFCDMVGSTRLSALMEAEDLHAVLVAFREMCGGIIQQAGGTVGQYLGDGLLAYFGYPLARENDAARAMGAALRIQGAIGALNEQLAVSGVPLPEKVAARIGVHSGLIVVTDLGRGRNAEAAAVVGETTNVAARLQGAAAVGAVLVSDTAARLAGDRFDFADAGERKLAGIEAPMRVWELRAERPATARARQRTLRHEAAPFFDRVNERAALRRAWQAVRRGRGIAFLLEAEPGMGKSRLIDEFRSTLGAAGRAASLLTCTPEDQSSSFQPVLLWVRQELALAAGTGPEATRAALHAALAETGAGSDHELQLAIQLDCATAVERQAFAHSPRRSRRNIVAVLLDLLLARCAAKGSHLLIVEDLHWADEGTLALVGALAGRCGAGAALMVLATTRNAQHDPVPGATVLKLSVLPEADAMSLVRAVVPSGTPDELVSRIVERTGGIPLFTEELARLSASAKTAAGAIPLTLRSTLSAQLDAAGPAKDVAQTAAAVGQWFDQDLLEALAPEEERSRIGPALNRLAAARVIERVPSRSPGAAVRYGFRHALMRDAAYDSMPRHRRRNLHGRIGVLLRDAFADGGAGRPELMAQHFAAADMPLDAAEQFEAAAARAAARSTHGEAAEHCRSGLEQVGRAGGLLPAAELEVRLQILLASQITATRGNADPAVEAAFERARAVAERIGNIPWLRRALRGLHTFQLVKGDIRRGLEISERVLALSAGEDDPGARIQMHRPHGLTLLYMGRFAEARRELLCAISLYDADSHAGHRFTYGSDPLVLSRSHLGWVEWFGGDRARAARECAEAVEVARTLDHPHSLAFALAFQCCLAEFADDPAAVRGHAAELNQLAERHDYAYWLAWARILDGWAQAALGQHDLGDVALLRGLADYEGTGAGLLVPYAHLLRASLLRQADPGRSASLLQQGHALAERNQMHLWLHWSRHRLG